MRDTGLPAGTRCLVRIPARAIRRDADGDCEAVVEDRFEMPNRVRVVLRVGELSLDWVEAEGEDGVVRFSIDASQVEVWASDSLDDGVPAVHMLYARGQHAERGAPSAVHAAPRM